MLKILTTATAITIAAGSAFAQEENQAHTAPTVSFELERTYSIPAFIATNIDEEASKLVDTLCDSVESKACLAAKDAVEFSQATRLQQMLTAQTTIEQAQLATMIAVAEMQRDDAQELAVNSANNLAEVGASGTLRAAEATTLLQAEQAKAAQAAAEAEVQRQKTTGAVVSAEELVATQEQLSSATAELSELNATLAAEATAMRLLALDLLFVCNDNIPEADDRCDPYEGQLSSQDVVNSIRAEAGFSSTNERNATLQELIDGAAVTN